MITFFLFENIKIKTILGVYDHEKIQKIFYVWLKVYFDIWRSYITDNLSDTIDSSLIRDTVIFITAWKNYNLVEKIAYDIWFNVKKLNDRIQKVEVTIYKKNCLTDVSNFSFTLSI